MKLEKFTKNKKQKQVVIGSIVGILILIGGICLYRTFAMYKVEKTFNVLEGTIPDFSSGDVTIAFTINSIKPTGVAFPNKNEGFTKNKVQCENGVQAEWDDEAWALKLQDSSGQSKIKCTIDFNAPTLTEYLKSKVSNVADGENGLIEQTHEATEQTGDYAKKDYRYIGANPNNYVCLEESGECNEDQLYRIIGVIPTQSSDNGDYEDRVKLVANIHEEKNYWTGDATLKTNDWTKSKLNTEFLNKSYWAKIQNYQKYIDSAKWYLSPITASTENSASNIYKEERANNVSNQQMLITHIGLIYPSDYAYATSGGLTNSRDYCLKESITFPGKDTSGKNKENYWRYFDDCKDNDWLYHNNLYYWLLSPSKSGAVEAMVATQYGGIDDYNSIEQSYTIVVYPSFYLKSNALYKNGTGTKENPYRISISNS